MPKYRRYYQFHQPVFITVVTNHREPWLMNNQEQLLSSMRVAKEKYPYKHLAHVIMKDHFHWMFEMQNSPVFSNLVAFVKRDVTWRLKAKGIQIKWQNRFYDHMIRDQNDLDRHLDYIHYNPIKHGEVTRPSDYRYSSFGEWKKRGRYDNDWGIDVLDTIQDLDFE